MTNSKSHLDGDVSHHHQHAPGGGPGSTASILENIFAQGSAQSASAWLTRIGKRGATPRHAIRRQSRLCGDILPDRPALDCGFIRSSESENQWRTTKCPVWSTYIKPLGDRLVTIGGRSYKSMARNGFVIRRDGCGCSRNPEQGCASARIIHGSEAKLRREGLHCAFGTRVLILLPYSGYLTNGYAQRLQV